VFSSSCFLRSDVSELILINSSIFSVVFVSSKASMGSLATTLIFYGFSTRRAVPWRHFGCDFYPTKSMNTSPRLRLTWISAWASASCLVCRLPISFRLTAASAA
jgi:hypothetical protein